MTSAGDGSPRVEPIDPATRASSDPFSARSGQERSLLVRITIIATGSTTACIMPPILLGAVAVRMETSIGLRASDIGLSVAAFFATAAAVVVTIGARPRMRHSPRTLMAMGLALAAASLAATSAVTSPAPIVVLAAVAGVGSALAYVGSSVIVATVLPPRAHGIAFGAMQSGITLATVLAGAAVPAIALKEGWPWAFRAASGLATCLLFLVLLLVPRVSMRQSRDRAPTTPLRRRIWILGSVALLASMAAACLNGFFVVSTVGDGMSERSAALLLMTGGIIGTLLRLLLGWMVRSRLREDATVATATLVLIAGGASGLLFLGSYGPSLDTAVALIAFAGIWGWPGLLNYLAVVDSPDGAARGASVTQGGTWIGAVAGPALFTTLPEHASYTNGWKLMAACSFLSAVLLVAYRRVRTELNPAEAAVAVANEP